MEMSGRKDGTISVSVRVFEDYLKIEGKLSLGELKRLTTFHLKILKPLLENILNLQSFKNRIIQRTLVHLYPNSLLLIFAPSALAFGIYLSISK